MTTEEQNSEQSARILIFDQSPLFAKALSELIGEHNPDAERLLAVNAQQAREIVKQSRPQLVVIDLDSGDTGVALLRDIKEMQEAPRCVVLITDGAQPSLLAAIRLQADGFISKRLNVEQFANQINLAAAGEMVISDSLTAALAVSLRTVPVADETKDIARLSPREVDVLYCIANGMSNRQISEQLKISDGTVKVHVKHVLKKLGFATRVEAALWASESGHKGPIGQNRQR